MSEVKFKTTINCSGCVARVTPKLDAIKGVKSWSVDVDHEDKILSVQLDGATKEDVENAVKKVGFKIEKI